MIMSSSTNFFVAN